LEAGLPAISTGYRPQAGFHINKALIFGEQFLDSL